MNEKNNVKGPQQTPDAYDAYIDAPAPILEKSPVQAETSAAQQAPVLTQQDDFLAELVVRNQKNAVNLWPWIFLLTAGLMVFILVMGGSDEEAELRNILFGIMGFAVFSLIMAIVAIVNKKKTLVFPEAYKKIAFKRDDAIRKHAIETINHEFRQGQLRYEGALSVKNARLYLFPSYIVNSDGASIHIIDNSEVGWMHMTTHRTNGVVINHSLHLYDPYEDHAIYISIANKEVADDLMRYLSDNFKSMIGYNAKMKKLYDKHKSQFIEVVRKYKETGELPFPGIR